MSRSPHQTNIGCREVSMMRTAVRSAWGQLATGPSGVRAQSVARMSRPSSPPPANGSVDLVTGRFETVIGHKVARDDCSANDLAHSDARHARPAGVFARNGSRYNGSHGLATR